MRRPKILIVDDLQENLISLEMILSDFEVDFVKATSGKDALRATIKDDFAMAILDVQMPGMDGYETLSLMRTRSKTKYLPVIFVSAIHQSDLHIIKGIETGAVDFIPKPIIPEILAGKVRVFLDLHQQKQELISLLHRFDEQNAELKQQREIAQKANEAKSLYLAYMSHEIRTQLNGIIGLSKIINSTELKPDQKDLMDTIVVSGDTLLGIINEILDFSKVESGQVALDIIDTDLRKLVDNIVNLLTHKAIEKKIYLKSTIDSTVPGLVMADALRLNQIITNLVNNALKFTENGGVTVSIKQIAEESGSVRFRFEVIDTGIGIPADIQGKLFNDYTQADVTTTRKYGGTGLGLAISKKLVSLMGGTIGVHSTPGDGSVFWFEAYFKVKKQSGENLRFKEISNENEEINLLIAEDNKANQMVIKHLLKNYKVRYDLVENGAQAVDMFRSNTYQLILMDMQMPDIDGLEATRLIRQYEKEMKLPPVYIVAITANIMDEDKQRCFEAGMNDYLTKPFREHEFKRILTGIGRH
jgi:two-component system, sensor histidine kinase